MSGLCGIADFTSFRVEPHALRALAESAAYRAPGGITYRCLGAGGLAHLARHAGDRDQPLLDAASQFCGVLDGRLDNRSELIALLAQEEGAEGSGLPVVRHSYVGSGGAGTEQPRGE